MENLIKTDVMIKNRTYLMLIELDNLYAIFKDKRVTAYILNEVKDKYLSTVMTGEFECFTAGSNKKAIHIVIINDYGKEIPVLLTDIDYVEIYN
jgi:hypothetical protein